jgi:signal transduction histidine kinase
VGPVGQIVLVVLAIVVDLIAWAGQGQVRVGPMIPLLVVPVMTAALYTVLLLRWRHPAVVFAVMWAYALVSVLVPQFQPFAGLFLALHAMASRTSTRYSALALASLIGPFALYSFNSARAIGSDFAQLLVLWMLLAAGVWGVGRISYGVSQRALRLSQLQAAEAAEAVRAERMRLARDLHDIVSHAVTTMLIQAAAAKTVVGETTDTRLERSLDVIQQSGVQAMVELHRMLVVLREEDGALEASPGATPPPTVADVAGLVQLSRAAGQRVQLLEEGRPVALDRSVAGAAYRVVQESLTNSLKHAGPDVPVTVRLQWSADSLRVTITNPSAGPAASPTTLPSSGHGLEGLRERVRLVGGALTTEQEADRFTVRADLPLSQLRDVAPVRRFAAEHPA